MEPLIKIIIQMLNVGIFSDSLKISKVILYTKKKMITQYFLTIDQFHCCLLYQKYLGKIYWNKLQHI